MGRSFMETCKFVGCLPSELYQKHEPTIGDFMAISALKGIEMDEEQELIASIGGGKPM